MPIVKKTTLRSDVAIRLANLEAYWAATCKPACRQTGFILFFFKIYSRS